MVDLTKYKDFPLKEKPPSKNNPIPLSVVPPQESLTPIWNSPFYMTPDEPADPRDCDRYPDSLYCGGFPFTLTPIGIEPSIVLDGCNVGIEAKPIMGWIKLPPVQLVYRKQTPECKFKQPEVPVPPSTTDFIPTDIPTKTGCLYVVTVAIDHWFVNYRSDGVIEATYQQYPNGILTSQNIFVWGAVAGIVVKNSTRLGTEGGPTIVSSKAYAVAKLDAGIGTGAASYQETRNESEYLNQFSKYVKLMPGDSWDYINRFFTYQGDAQYIVSPPVWRIAGIREIWCDLSPVTLIAPPPPPPLKNCDCNMTCCPSTTQNDQLLRSLLQKVDKLSKIIGVDDYPVNLPSSLISKDEGFFGNLLPNENVNVPSLTQFLTWYVLRFDEIMGQWEIPIEIKDSDPTTPGEQPVGIKLPNIAECLAEMFTLCFQTNINSETLLNMGMRTLGETEADKQQNFITYKLLQSLTDWVGYKQKDVKVKMPLMTTLNKTRYDQILQESEVEVAVAEFDDKFGLEADLMRFREAASILQASHKVKVDPNGDIKAQILKYLLDTFKSTQKVNGEDTEQDFEDFLEEVEAGFINTPGVSNSTDPYGRPYNERPKIRDLTNLSTDNPEP